MNLEKLLTDSTQSSPSRACFLLRVKPERLKEYVQVHQAVWPDMLDALSRTGWRHYSLFLEPTTGLVVGYFESDDAAAAMAAMEDEEINTRWQNEMAQYFQQPDGGASQVLRQYFYLP